VILSGTATDGTLGLDAIKADGRITYAQDESARDDSMPRGASLGFRFFRRRTL
jgi:two-component system CheB/CheR fusion protein